MIDFMLRIPFVKRHYIRKMRKLRAELIELGASTPSEYVHEKAKADIAACDLVIHTLLTEF